MAYKIIGRIISVGITQELTAKNGNIYQKRDFVMTVRKFDPYTGQPTEEEGNTPKFSLLGERCNDLNNIFKGDIVTVAFEINGRSYEKDGKIDYFTEIRPIKVQKASCGSIERMEADREPMTVETGNEHPQRVSVAEVMAEMAPKNKEENTEEDDDLPF